MARERLPDRRRAITRRVLHNGQTIHITVGYDDRAEVREVFANGGKEGSEMHALISDACTVISIALQHGVQVSEMTKSLGARPEWGPSGEVEAPASVIGAILHGIVGEVRDAEESAK